MGDVMLYLSDTEKERIRVSWSQVIAAPQTSAELFYGRLFEAAPETRKLFKGDMAAQGQKLIETINTVVDNLDEDLSVPVSQLGARHQQYFVTAPHYDSVGAALLWMLESMIGPAFDKPARDAWTKAYGQISEKMLGAYI